MNKQEYHRQYNQTRYHIRRQAYIDQLGGKCVECNSVKDLQFDHIDASTKNIDICKLLNYPKSLVDLEILKCQLLCKPHHVNKTIRNNEHKGGHNRIDLENAKHGTSIMYHKFKCKCDICRNWKKSTR